MNRCGLQWKDAPVGYGPRKTLSNWFVRWGRLGVFARIFAALAAKSSVPGELMIDRTHLKALRRAASLFKGASPRRSGRTCGGLNSKTHVVCDGKGRPVVLLLSEGQMSGRTGAALPAAEPLICDRGRDTGRFRKALVERGIAPCWCLNCLMPLADCRKTRE